MRIAPGSENNQLHVGIYFLHDDDIPYSNYIVVGHKDKPKVVQSVLQSIFNDWETSIHENNVEDPFWDWIEWFNFEDGWKGFVQHVESLNGYVVFPPAEMAWALAE